MLHEVLFGLLGHGVFAQPVAEYGFEEVASENAGDRLNAQRRSKHERCKVPAYLVPHVMSVAEAASIEQLMVVGQHYRELGEFISTCKQYGLEVSDSNDETKEKNSLILRSFCDGIQQALDEHTEVVCEIEQLVLRQPTVTLSRIKYLVAESGVVLERLVALCDTIATERLTGGKIVDLLYKKLQNCGVASVRRQFERLLHGCAQVFFNLVQAWMMHGVLADPGEDFFLQERPYKVFAPPLSTGSGESIFNLAAQSKHSWVAEYEWRSQVRINKSMLPFSLIGDELAKKIEFSGKAMRVLQRRNSSAFAPPSNSQGNLQQSGDGSVPLVLVLQVDPKEPFQSSATRLSKLIRAFYQQIAARLCQLIVQESRFLDVIQFKREFFLLGRGAFFTSFLELCEPILRKTPEHLKQVQSAINSRFQEAAALSGLDAWPEFSTAAFERLHLSIERHSIEFPRFPDSASAGPTTQQRPKQGGDAPLSSISDLALVGDVMLPSAAGETARRNCLRIGQDPRDRQRGGIWHVEKMPVENGFRSSVTFCSRRRSAQSAAVAAADDDDDDSSAPLCVALCVQHDTYVGPSALDALGEFPWSGLSNCLSFSVHYSSNLTTVHVQASDGSKTWRSEEAPLPMRFEEFRHTLVVDYGVEIDERTTSSLWTLNVKLLDEARRVLIPFSKVIDIRKETRFQPQVGSGRAWTGVLAAAGPNKVPVDIAEWTFRPRQRESNDKWQDLLALKMRVEWPLNLIFSQTALDQYNKLFQFLLGLKRVEAALKNTWGAINQTRFKHLVRNPKHNRRLMLMWRLRSAMSFLVNNLQFHVQIDNIDSLQKQLEIDIERASDFAMVARAHELFLEKLISASYMGQKQVRVAIQSVLSLCLQFCSLVDRFVQNSSEALDASEWEAWDGDISALGQTFRQQIGFLYAIMVETKSPFLLRLDYNHYFGSLAARKNTFTL